MQHRFRIHLSKILRNGVPQLISMAGGFASGLANIGMALVIAVYLTISKDKLISQLKRFLYAFTSTKVNTFLLKVGKLTNVTFSNFVAGQLVEAVIIGVLCYIGCLIFRFSLCANFKCCHWMYKCHSIFWTIFRYRIWCFFSRIGKSFTGCFLYYLWFGFTTDRI